MNRRLRHWCLLSCLSVLAAGCHRQTKDGTLVVTQAPPQAPRAFAPADLLDTLYPPGSRVVVVSPEQTARQALTLSKGLLAAGNPRLAPDGAQILFCGKSDATAAWQIFQVGLDGDSLRRLTDLPHGAMDPAWLPDGRFAFVSPVPKLSTTDAEQYPPPAIYAQPIHGGSPERLSSGAGAISQLTVLNDGRILFVAELQTSRGRRDGLFTINSDGTEVTAFAALHDNVGRIRRPRELPDGRVIFLAKPVEPLDPVEHLEQVELRRPFSSRQPYAPTFHARVLAADPGIRFPLLASCRAATSADLRHSTAAILGINPASQTPCIVFDDPLWDDLEAVECAQTMKPMGHLSTVNSELDFGRLLCLNANLSQAPDGTQVELRKRAARVRFLTTTAEGQDLNLGETEVHPDGSFLVELPADQPLGLETLDAEGQVIRRLHPTFWVRPGENRACIGCHEPHNQSPDNFRPLAVKKPPIRIGLTTQSPSLARHP